MTKERLFTEKEITRRIQGLFEILEKEAIDVSIIHHNADMFYFTGTVQDGYFVISKNGRYSFAVRRNYERALLQTPIRPVELISSLKDIKEIVHSLTGNTPGRIGLALDVLSASTYLLLKNTLFPDAEIVDISFSIRMQRAVKSEEEIEMMRSAAEISHAVYEAVPELLKDGIDEWDLCINLEYVARKKEHLGFIRLRNPRLEMYFGHVLSGPEAATTSYTDAPTGGEGISVGFAQGSTRRTIKRGDLVSVDTMMNRNGYLNDQTRLFSIGHPSEKLLRAYELSLKIHKFFKDKARPGEVSGKLYEEIWKIVEESSFKEFFMGVGSNRVSFIGHGLGIEVDEFPFIASRQKTVLQSGMVVALEPKFIIPDEGISGIENTYLITPEGAKALNISKEELVIL